MKESNWKECIEENSAITISSDKEKAKSLIKIAKGRIEFLENKEIEKLNANYFFEGYYTSATELLHALLTLKGYKVRNHICLGYFLRDILERRDLFLLFDDCRFKRNSLVYYGRGMETEVAKNTISKAKRLINELNTLVNEMLNQ